MNDPTTGPSPEQRGFGRAIEAVANGIGRLEEWRTARDPEADALFAAKIEAQHIAIDAKWAEHDHLNRLRLIEAVEGTKEAKANLQEALESYHSRNAIEFGERAVFIAAQDGFLSGFRARKAERQSERHARKAQKAAKKLLGLLDVEA